MDQLMVTDFAQFYRATDAEEETRYYPMTANLRVVAREFDAGGDPPVVSGFAAYDTAISTEYAVDLYPTKAQAQAHEVSKPAKAPTTILPELRDGEPDPDFPESGEAGTKPLAKKHSTRRSKRRGG